MSDEAGPVTVGDDAQHKSLEELVSTGCKFVVEGDLFKAMLDLIDKLMMDGGPDEAAVQFLLQLRIALLQSSVPVKTKIGSDSKIEIATRLPT